MSLLLQHSTVIACGMPRWLEMKGVSKYQPLLEYLQRQGEAEVMLSFGDIEGILGDRLPTSARTQRGWWSNRSRGALQSTAWRSADYLVKALDLAAETVTFHKPPARYRLHAADGVVQWDQETIKSLRQHMGLTQMEFAQEMGIRQQTVSEWETGVYQPNRASAKHLMRVAQQAGFLQPESLRLSD